MYMIGRLKSDKTVRAMLYKSETESLCWGEVAVKMESSQPVSQAPLEVPT